MHTVTIKGAQVEIPRLVKKPGEWLRVDTEKDLTDALADGWVLRLKPVAAVKAQEPLTEAPDAPEPSTSRNDEGTASEPDAERTEPVKVRKKPGRKPKPREA
jgi:hypothetical protein